MRIRTRLALLFTLVVSLLLAALMLGMYRYASYLREDGFHRQLFLRARTAGTVALEDNEMSEQLLRPFRQDLLRQLPHEGIAVFDEHSRPVFSLGSAVAPPDDAARRALRLDSVAVSARGDTQRVYLAYEDEGHMYSVAVSAYDEHGLRQIRRLGFALLIVFAGAVLVVFGTGYWFARRSMAPISDITKRAETLTATDLHIRIDEGNGADELAHLAHAFNGMLDRLETAFTSQRHFVAHASHEMRTPLTTLEGQLEVALMHMRSELEYETVLRAALDDVRSLRALTNDLLLLARADANFPDAASAPCRIDELVFSAIDTVHERWPQRRIETAFSDDIDEARLSVTGSADLLRTALENILDNALKYSGSAAPVRVLIATNEHGIRIDVRNDGATLDPEEIPLLFGAFFRGERVRRLPGTGIGLTLIRAIALHHHGSFSLANTGSGVLARLTLPSASAN